MNSENEHFFPLLSPATRNLWHSEIFIMNLKSLRNRFVMLQFSAAFRFQKYFLVALFSLPIFTLYF